MLKNSWRKEQYNIFLGNKDYFLRDNNLHEWIFFCNNNVKKRS